MTPPLKPHIPPAWQLPGLLDGSVSAVSWPIPKRMQPTRNGPWMTVGVRGHVILNGRAVSVLQTNDEAEIASFLTAAQSPFGKPGDVLACKETWAPYESDGYQDGSIVYRASYDENAHGSARMQGAVRDFEVDSETAAKFEDIANQMDVLGERWFSPVTLPAKLSRLHLRVLSVRAQRCVGVTEEEALAEGGWTYATCPYHKDPVKSLRELWQPYYARRGLDWANAWRWVAKVERIQGKLGE
jgi:hypothetical protein